MNDQNWKPLFVRESGDDDDEFSGLHEGIPLWLEGSLWRWLMDRAAEGGPALIHRLERRLHIELSRDSDRPLGGRHTPPNALVERYWKAVSVSERLTLVDALLFDMQDRCRVAADSGDQVQVERLIDGAQRLDVLLTEGGSLWAARIQPPSWGLVRRVNATTDALMRRAADSDTDAARKIASAWTSCYGHHPDADKAYREAVLAVEAAAIPTVLPKAQRATLGTVIAHIRDTLPSWSVGGLDATEMNSGETLLAMLKLLWHNQERHALGDGTVIEVTQREAEAALSVAVVLVHWFTAGLVKRQDAQDRSRS